jgi:hypothetical protein
MKQTKSKPYIIPGLGENTKAKNYEKVLELARNTI